MRHQNVPHRREARTPGASALRFRWCRPTQHLVAYAETILWIDGTINVLLKLILSVFLFNVTTRKFWMTCMACILLLLDSDEAFIYRLIHQTFVDSLYLALKREKAEKHRGSCSSTKGTKIIWSKLQRNARTGSFRCHISQTWREGPANLREVGNPKQEERFQKSHLAWDRK